MMTVRDTWSYDSIDATERRVGLGGKSGPGVTARPAQSIHDALPPQCIAHVEPPVAYLEKYP